MKKVIFSNHINEEKYNKFFLIDDFLSFLKENKIKLKRVFNNKFDEFFIIVDGNHRFNHLTVNYTEERDIKDYIEIVEEQEVSTQEIFLFKKLFFQQQKEIGKNSKWLFQKGDTNINLNEKEIELLYLHVYSDCTEGSALYIKGFLEFIDKNNYIVKGKLEGEFGSYCGSIYRKESLEKYIYDFEFKNKEELFELYHKKVSCSFLIDPFFEKRFDIKNLYKDLHYVEPWFCKYEFDTGDLPYDDRVYIFLEDITECICI